MLIKKTALILITLFVAYTPARAGDVASFVDLGFSPDGRFYVFGQHGVLFPSLRPWAEMFIVDVSANNFVPNGRISQTNETPIQAGQDGSNVLTQLKTRNATLVSRYGVNFNNQGLPLYISRSESPPRHGEVIEFRDFITGNSYRAEIVPTIQGSGANLRSRFHINLQIRESNGHVRHLTVGTPQFWRPRVLSYNFRRVLIDPRGESLIFVIEMRRASERGFEVRYMVEALRL